jgi:hypothetical protein
MSSQEIEERWEVPGNKCDLCGRIRPVEEHWLEKHTTMGCSGFNFTFCFKCDKDRRAECDAVMVDCLLTWKRKCEKHWSK